MYFILYGSGMKGSINSRILDRYILLNCVFLEIDSAETRIIFCNSMFLMEPMSDVYPLRIKAVTSSIWASYAFFDSFMSFSFGDLKSTAVRLQAHNKGVLGTDIYLR